MAWFDVRERKAHVSVYCDAMPIDTLTPAQARVLAEALAWASAECESSWSSVEPPPEAPQDAPATD